MNAARGDEGICILFDMIRADMFSFYNFKIRRHITLCRDHSLLFVQ